MVLWASERDNWLTMFEYVIFDSSYQKNCLLFHLSKSLFVHLNSKYIIKPQDVIFVLKNSANSAIVL